MLEVDVCSRRGDRWVTNDDMGDHRTDVPSGCCPAPNFPFLGSLWAQSDTVLQDSCDMGQGQFSRKAAWFHTRFRQLIRGTTRVASEFML